MSEDNDQPGQDLPDSPVKLTLAGRLRAYFFAGILITAPISITFYITWNFIDLVDSKVTPLIPEAYNPRQWGVPGIGLLLVAVALTLVGAITAGFVGRVWLRFTEWILSRTPVLNGIYSAVKQVFETVLAQKSNAFREVVLLEYPRKGIWTLGFVTGQTVPSLRPDQEQDWVNIFVPTTPNPTSGFLLFLPRSDLTTAAISVEDGLKLVISGGIVAPTEISSS